MGATLAYSWQQDTLIVPRVRQSTGSASRGSSQRKERVPGIAVFCALSLLFIEIIALYGRSVSFGFAGDDWTLLNQASPGIAASFAPAPGSYHYNPLAISARAIMYKAFGANPMPYHIVTLLMFWACAALLFWLAWRLSDRFFVGILTAVVYVAFGSLYEVAIWSVVAFQQLPALFLYLAGFMLYLFWHDRALRRSLRLWAYAGFIVCLVLTPLVYEPTITLVVACALYRFFVLDQLGKRLKQDGLVATARSWLADFSLPAVLFICYLIFKVWLARVTGAAQAPALNQPLASHGLPLTWGILQGFVPGTNIVQLGNWTFTSVSPNRYLITLVAELVVLGLLLIFTNNLYRFLICWDLAMVLSLIFGLGSIQSRHLAFIVAPAAILYALIFLDVGKWARAMAIRLGAERQLAVVVMGTTALVLMAPVLAPGVQCSRAEVADWGVAQATTQRLTGQLGGFVAANPQATTLVVIDFPQVANSRYGEFDYMFLNAIPAIMDLQYPGRFVQVVVARTQEPLAWTNTVYETPQQLTDLARPRNALVLEYNATTGNIAQWAPPRPLIAYFDPNDGPNGSHWVSTQPSPPPGFEATSQRFGYLIEDWQSDAHPLYGCVAGTQHFVSDDSACEGQQALGIEGYLFATAPPGVQVVPVYRCQAPYDHSVSNDASCGGNTNEGLLGYAMQQP